MTARTVIAVLLVAGLWSIPSGQLVAESLVASMPAKHRALFEKHCLDCHRSETREAGIDLEAIPLAVSRDIPTADLWQKVLNAINSGEMPPRDAEPLRDADKAAFLEDLTGQMVIARRILGDSGGVIPLRRLNRREYTNTLEALLGVRPDVSLLPDDQVGAGFDTQGASLFFSSDQLENYLTTATDALRVSLLSGDPPQSRTRRVEPEQTQTEHYRDYLAKLKSQFDRSTEWHAQSSEPPSAFGILDAYQAKNHLKQYKLWSPQLNNYLARPETQTGTTLILTIKAGGPTRVKLPTVFGTAPGMYTVRLRAAHYPDADERFHYVELSSGFSSDRKQIAWRKVTGTLDDPQVLTFQFEQTPGDKTQLWLHQRTHQDRFDKNLWTLHQQANGIGTKPGVWIDWAEVEGPVPIENPSEITHRILPKREDADDSEEYAKQTLQRFAKRAFRGAVPRPAFMAKVFNHFQSERGEGKTFEEALVKPLAIILSSPEFLYMVESDRGDGSTRLSDFELAVRLSYFLWSSPPDDELMRIAELEQLRDPLVLREQTRRLLGDPRSKHFVRDFSHQWLSMKRLGMFQFDGVQYETFDNAARENAREEVFQTIAHVMDQSLPLGTLLNANFVVINDLLAGFYGIPGVEGHEFRKVAVSPESPRGGLLGTAAVMAMGSDGLRTSPVERGAWVLRHLLNDPPAPAPPNVPQLSRLDAEVLSARELQKAHQEQPQCAQCHRKIDPIGYGLENFAADGLWRSQETVGTGKRKFGRFTNLVSFEIDPQGTLPSGQKFADYFELRSAIAEYEDEFARGFVEAMIAYALGRPYGFSDQDLADSILADTQQTGYSVPTMIDALIQSDAFQSR